MKTHGNTTDAARIPVTAHSFGPAALRPLPPKRKDRRL